MLVHFLSFNCQVTWIVRIVWNVGHWMKDYFLFVCQNRKATSIRSRTNKLQAEVKKAKEKHASLNPSGSLAITLIFENTIFPIIINAAIHKAAAVATSIESHHWSWPHVIHEGIFVSGHAHIPPSPPRTHPFTLSSLNFNQPEIWKKKRKISFNIIL